MSKSVVKGFLYLEDGQMFQGEWLGGKARAGEVIFNTSHNGYEEIATDPSYFGQIMVMTAPMQGNYGVDKSFWESSQLWIEGFIALDINKNDKSWIERLDQAGIPILNGIDTRDLVFHLRDKGTLIGALVQAEDESSAKKQALELIDRHKKLDKDWCYHVSSKEKRVLSGAKSSGPRVAIIDYGTKQNIVRELLKRCSEVGIFPSRTSLEDIQKWKPDGILLSNGPGDPGEVQETVETVQALLGSKVIFGICMGQQILARALGAKTYRLKFGHHGANHPVKDLRSGRIYVTSQNHGYSIDPATLPKEITVSHMNLNDQTISGISYAAKKCFSVQFHPECYPGPRDAGILFDEFIDWIQHEL
jgi:carbamoyl-phosphate synthase small subunit